MMSADVYASAITLTGNLVRGIVLDVLYASLLLPLILVLAFLVRRKSLVLVYGLWALVLVRLILPPGLSSPVSLGSALNNWPAVSAPLFSLTAPMQISSPDPNLPPTTVSGTHALPSMLKTGSAKRTASKPLHPLIPWVSAWAAGVLLTGFYFLRKRRRFKKIARQAQEVTNAPLLAMASKLRHIFGIRRPVSIVSSNVFNAPFTIGLVRPRIFLPACLLGNADTQVLQAVLSHEFVHVRHWDDLWVRLQLIIQCFYFFHPVVWFVNQRLHLARETLCDRAVLLRNIMTSKTYGHSLVQVLRLGCSQHALPPLPGFGHHTKTLAHRMRALMEDRPMKHINVPVTTLTLALIGLFLLPMAPYPLHAEHRNAPVALEGNILINQMQGWFARVFDPAYHQRSKLPVSLQASTKNPNLTPPQQQWQTFQHSLDQAGSPGIDYCTGGAPVRAVAGGIVLFVGETKTYAGHPDGYYVRVVHDNYDNLSKKSYPRVPLYRSQVYRSSYYHLSKVAVSQWQAVKRGDIIGQGMAYGPDNKEKFKLVLEERGNLVNPDHYGPNLSFMVKAKESPQHDIALDEANDRLDRQLAIISQFDEYYKDKDSDDIYKKAYGQVDTEKFSHYPIFWSTVDRFHYLEYLYQSRKDLFPGLDEKTFSQMREGFYANQAIYLTLPL
jgi:beta-lactamase regulating signal transducer with metallopeptidase domain